jgi:biopolymer transport protein ExbD
MKTTAEDQLMAEINMTPLVDIMLVLLIVFMVTVPALLQAVPIELPKTASQKQVARPDPIIISINAKGEAFWNREAQSSEQLQASMQQAAKQSPQAMLQIQADKSVPYEHVMKVLAASHRAGLTHLAFMSEAQR